MNQQELKEIVIQTLRSIAPEVEEGELDVKQPLRDQVDLDSMDWLNFLIGLHKKTAVEIPEADYAQLISLDNILVYLSDRVTDRDS